MKTIFTLFLLLGPGGLSRAEAQHKKRADSTRVTIHFNNNINRNNPVDSVLIIFDRYNLTGAGTVKKIFYPVNNKVIIENVPEGKFYITVICLGIYHDNFSGVSYVYEKRRNKNTFRFRLKHAEAFNTSTVYIPAEKIDAANLSVLRKKSTK
jgi:hypothetical protein